MAEPGATQQLYGAAAWVTQGKSFYPLYGEVHVSKNHSTKADHLQKNYHSDSFACVSETIILFYFFETERVYLQISSKRGNF